MKLARYTFILLLLTQFGQAQTPTGPTAATMEDVLLLVPTSGATAIVVKSGNWSDPTIWTSGKLPIAGDTVWIPAGFAVVQDVTTPRLKWVRLDGQLSPAVSGSAVPWPPITLDQLIALIPTAEQVDVRNAAAANGVDTSQNLPLLPRPPPPAGPITLNVETLVTTMGSTLSCGHPSDPYQGQWTIFFIDTGPIDTTADPFMLGRGIHVMGNYLIYGRPVATQCLTTGNVKGDTTVTLTQPAVGWRVGDQIHLPGVGYGSIDDDNPTIAAISTDLKTITLTAPLNFDHGVADRYGNPRSMFAGNISRRSYTEESENKTVIAQRAHHMVMYDPADNESIYHCEYAAFYELGRTDKSKTVTDPDGKGGGLANPRARYNHHFHRTGPNLVDVNGVARTPRQVSSCLIYGSPGWGLVNHDSYCTFDNNFIIYVYGSGLVTEFGTETGCFCNNIICRSRHSFTQETVDDDRGVADWGFSGVGIWLQGGGVTVMGATITGQPHDAVTVMSVGFSLNGVTQVYNTKNLRVKYTATPTIPIKYVPFEVSGVRFFGCKNGPSGWNLGDNPTAVPPVGMSTMTDIKGEADNTILLWGYESNVNVSQVYGCRIGSTFTNTAVGHTGVNTNINYDTVTVMGYDVALFAPTDAISTINSVTHNAMTGVRVWNADNSPRTLTLTNITMLPLSAADQATVSKQSHYDFYNYSTIQNYTRMNVVMYMNMADDSIYEMFFPNIMQGIRTPQIQKDAVTLDGAPIYFTEMAQSFVLSNANPSINTSFPALTGLTNIQIYNQYGMAIADTVLPADCTPVPGCMAVTSTTAPVMLPRMDVNKTSATNGYEPNNYQQTSTPTGYVTTVHDSKGNVVNFRATNLTDKTYNLVTGTVEGIKRTVAVQCDSTQTFPPNW